MAFFSGAGNSPGNPQLLLELHWKKEQLSEVRPTMSAAGDELFTAQAVSIASPRNPIAN